MSTPSKNKGDRAERALVAYLTPWWPNVRRTKAGGEKDLGDLSGLRDRDGDEWCVQVADRKSLVNHGAVLAKALEASCQALRLGAPWWVLVIKRPGCADVAEWFVWLPAGMLAEVMGRRSDLGVGVQSDGWQDIRKAGAYNDLACITVRAWVALIAPEQADA